MAKISLWLPPFSPDYSGASAVLFDLKTVTAMHDASGCTGNYTGYDEPRWYGSQSGVFCSGLRQMDAVLGDDEKLMKKMEAAAKDLKPDLLALVGSPVPMVIGADLKGIAMELEERTGIPSFGFDTTGTAYYDKGAYLAAKALMDRFTEENLPQEGRVNILGALPMDFGMGADIACLRELLAGQGYEVGLCLAYGYTLQDLKEAAKAQVNLAVSRAGYLMALYMEEKFHIPWLCGFPAGKKGGAQWLSALKRVAGTGVSEVLAGAAYPEEGHGGRPGWESADAAGQTASAEAPAGQAAAPAAPAVLIIGEQVMANSLRRALQEDFGFGKVTVGCLYGLEKALALPGDLDLPTEKEIQRAVNLPDYPVVVADPFLKVLLKEGTGKQFLPFAQYAISSKLGVGDGACVTGGRFHEWMEKHKTA